ncbi:hypothetical protein ABPG72_012272 [Tetrahymena utriculariae]
MSEKGFWVKVNKPVQLPNEPILAEGYFSKKGNYMSGKRYFRLYNNFIYYFDEKNSDHPKGYVNIDFDMHFEVIRQKTDKKDNSPSSIIGQPKGLRLDKFNAKTEITTNDESLILKWRDILRNKINQRGFHELFKAHKKIGKGNFASVYLTERLEDNRQFAVKAFSKEAAYNQENGKEALINEIELMRALNHKNIIRLHEVFETENSLYMILDLLEGGQLYDKIKAKYRFTVEESKYIMKGLLEGIAEMHSKNIMHRDLKPENLIFKTADSLDLAIVDLGLATRADIDAFMFVRCGTPGFVAPEVINIKDLNTKYDVICDIFSLGLIFHILLLGRTPFNGKNYNEILAQNRASNISFEGTEYLKLPLPAYDLLKKMLDNDPKTRITAKKALQHQFFTQKKGEQMEIESPQLTEAQKMKQLQEEHKQRLGSTNKDSPMPSPQIMPTRAMKNLQDDHGSFKMPNTPVLTGRTEAISNDGFDSPSVQFANDRQISSMADKNRSSIFSPQVKRASQFGSPQSGFGNIASNFKKVTDDVQEEEAKKNDDGTNKKSDQIRNNLKNLGI